MGVYAAWYCQKHRIPYEGMKIKLVWSKSTAPPARIDYIEAHLALPAGCPEAHQAGLIAQTEKCLVRNTITDAPEIKITL